MTAPTDSALLEKIKTAIGNLMDGGAIQSYSMPDGRNLRAYSLDELLRLQKYYEAKVQNASSTSHRTYIKFRRPQ